MFKVVTCTLLVTPPHAVKQIAPCSNTFGSTCTFSCQTGYTSSKGNVTRTCLASEKWSGSDISCTGIQTLSRLLSLMKTQKYGTSSLKPKDRFWGPYNYYLCDTDDSLSSKVLLGTEFDTNVHITPTPVIRTPLSVLCPFIWFVSMLRLVNYVSIIKHFHVSVLCLAMLSLIH